MAKLTLNGKAISLDVDPSMPLLYAIRDIAELTGTKFGCGLGLCGACTIHLDGNAIRSCVTPISAAEGKSITTIEGLATCLLYTSPSPRDKRQSRMPSSA